MANVQEKYKKHELRDHIYQLPDTYIGSIEQTQIECYLYDEETNRMNKRKITIVPGLYKIFDEILVNALDQIERLKSEIKENKTEDIKPVKNISVNINKETGEISVMNDGDGIDVELHPDAKVYVPQMIFGELLTSANYDQDAEKIWGGKNGYGAKLANIFSKDFTIETIDHRRHKQYIQNFHNNMLVTDKPTIKASRVAPYTKITFIPDYTRFGMRKLSDDMFDLFHKRTIDACARRDQNVTVSFNGKKIDIKTFDKYVELYIGSKDELPRVAESCGDRWSIVATTSENGQFDQVSFVNAINTSRGGKHVDYIVSQITKRLAKMIKDKTKKDVKDQYIKDNLRVFITCLIVNPSFDTQTKDSLTTATTKFGSKCELSDKFFATLYKSGIVDKVLSISDFHDQKKLAKTDGSKKSKLIIAKLDDAIDAGTRNSEGTTLILTEGDSAKVTAVAGVSAMANGRKKYGIFPLRGKVMNVKDQQSGKIASNEEITHIKKALGLEQGKDYKDLSSLRYESIMILTDQDHDGSHIKGLIINLFQSLFPSLYKHEGFIKSMLTPIIKAKHSNGTVMSFYNISDFKNWKEKLDSSSSNGSRGWTFKYYKGLGTSTDEEAKEYFHHPKITKYIYTGKDSDNAINLAFDKKLSDDRKKWLMRYDPDCVLDYVDMNVPYEEFVHKDLIHFSNRDLERSIIHIMDGCKESIRKIIYACMKRKLYNKEIKVAQLAAYVAEVSEYHHGEVSLQEAIIGMAQVFVGSGNISLLDPRGQFGSRLQGGKDASQPRYIFTVLTNLFRLIFREEDIDPEIIKYKKDEGREIEPTYYIPTVPLSAINGGIGIGTGFSCTIPCHNPVDIVAMLKIIISALNKNTPNIVTKTELKEAIAIIKDEKTLKLSNIKPWYLGFTGTIEKNGENSFLSKGVYRWVDDTTVEITELPIGTWTNDYKEFLSDLIIQGSKVLKDYENHYTSKTVKFILKLYPDVRNGIESSFETMFKLSSSKNMSLNNLHMFGQDGAIKKYESISEVIREWACTRIEKYLDRKNVQLKRMENSFVMISAKVKFIQEVIEGTIKLLGKRMQEVVTQLTDKNYPTATTKVSNNDSTYNTENIANTDSADNRNGGTTSDNDNETEIEPPSYTYLTRMPIHTLTLEKKQELEKEAHELQMKIQALKAKPIQKIWEDELDEFAFGWEQYKQVVEAELEANRTNSVVKLEKPKGKAKPKK